MAKTKITDIIVPEVFAPYVIAATRESSALVKSGIAVSSPVLDELVGQGGKTVNMPFWKPLAGDDEVLSDSASLTPQKIDAAQDVAAMLIRGKAWSANELAGALAGSDPMTAIGNQVAQWWSAREQQILISILEGIFDETLADSHVNDISTKTGNAAIIGAEAILDTKQILGDAAGQFTAMAMHSAVLTTLQKQNLVEYIPDSQGVVNFPTYMGYQVMTDDTVPVDGGVYCTYLFAAGAFGRGDGVPASLTPVEAARDSLASDDILINRRAMVLHPFGVAWTNPTISTATPQNSDLAAGDNWQKVYDDKAIGIAMLKHKI